MSGHLNDADLGRFVRGQLAPDALIAADDHIAGCDACRTRAARIGDADTRLLELESLVRAEDVHLSDAQVQALVSGVLSSTERASLEQHLEQCSTCATQVGDLEGWVQPRSAWRPRAWAAAAAVVLLLSSFAVVRLLVQQRETADPQLAGIELLSPEERARVDGAIQAGVAEAPDSLAALLTGPDVLMGTGPAGTFRVLAPLNTVTLSGRPLFRWEPLEGATEYSIAVLDQSLRQIAGAAGVTDTSWTPPEVLARGETYTWQVTARVGSQAVVAPVPPAPMARFIVMREPEATTIERLSRSHPDAHVLLGILCMQAGARAEAEMHLTQVPATGDHGALARRTLDRLQPGAAP